MAEVKQKLKILITNDDGIHAPGLFHLIEAILEDEELNSGALDMRVSAPSTEQSAKSHSITLREKLVATSHSFQIQKLEKNQVSAALQFHEIPAWAVEGTPADSCRIGLNAVFQEFQPDLIISGINRGANSGLNVIYSGTVAAAMEGVINGYRALALSLDHPETYPQGNWNYVLAAQLALPVIKRYLKLDCSESDFPADVLLNVTLPNCDSKDEVKGYKMCKQGSGKWCEEFILEKKEGDSKHGSERRVFSVSGKMVYLDKTNDMDCQAVREKWVTISTLTMKQGSIIQPFYERLFRPLF